MSIRIIRKALGLLVVDIAIIIGIFVLQFRTDSSIIEKIGNLQLTFSQTENQENNMVVQNKFRMSYNGLNLFFDDQTPAIIRSSDADFTPVQLVSWAKQDDLSYILNFTNDIKLTFELASNDLNASLAVIADLPSNVSDFAIPFNYSSNMKIQKDDGNRVILNAKKGDWELTAFSLDSGYFDLNKRDYVATYSIYDETQKFTFDSIVDLPIADSQVYEQNILAFKNNLIDSFKANTAESNLSEQVVVSYIAAQAERGNYVQAIEDIPANLKKSKQRTYLSAPYLNTLEEMNQQLEKAISDYEKKISEAAVSGSLDIFTVHDIANFICIHSEPSQVVKLLQNAVAADIQNCSLAQATGILQVFVNLSALNSDYANLLQPVLESCVERITRACSYEGNVLTISENDTFLSVIQAVETGVAIMRYGIISDNPTLQKAGYVLINSYLSDNTSYDLRTLANLYPLIAYNNWYYPHFERVITKDSNNIWAWTCAKDITYEKDSEGAITLTIDFPETYTHYVILKGIPAFTSIYIYNMAFRTDPRFETYNSSGYVYKSNGTLLLKSRHKTRFETVRMEYHEKAKPAETVEEKKPEADTTETPSSANTAETQNTAGQTAVENTAAPAEETVPAVAQPETPVEVTPAAPVVEETPAAPAETPAATQRRSSWRRSSKTE